MTRESSSPAPPSPLRPGMRIEHNGARGTIRFLGRLPGRGAHTWVGIEWDDASRGKHSGTVDGASYFTTSQPGAASFLKQAKLGDGGRNHLLRAVVQRYVHDAQDTAYRADHLTIGGADVHILAEMRARALRKLEAVDVSGLGVASLRAEQRVRTEAEAGMEAGVEAKTEGETEAEKETDVGADAGANADDGMCTQAPSEQLVALRELHVARSLFSSVADLHEILHEFRDLCLLDASRNVLSDARPPARIFSGTHDALRELVLSSCRISWDSIASLCAVTPHLRELRLHNCSLHTLGTPTSFTATFTALQVVDLDANRVPWAQLISHLGPLPMLRELYVSRNALPDTDLLGPAVAANGAFAQLQHLSVAHNALRDWRVVDALDALPRLRGLSLRGNAVAAERDEAARVTWRMEAVARVGGLRELDGSRVSADERRHAERAYAREALRGRAAGGGGRGEGVEGREEHPRLAELCRVHEIGRGGRRKGKEEMVRVSMRGVGRDGEVLRRVVRMVPRGVGVEKVVRVARRLVRGAGRAKVEGEEVGAEEEEDKWEEEDREIGAWGAEVIVDIRC